MSFKLESDTTSWGPESIRRVSEPHVTRRQLRHARCPSTCGETFSLFSLSSHWVLGKSGGLWCWRSQHPPWTVNRWDLTLSTQITAKKALACSSDRFQTVTVVNWNQGRVQGWGNAREIGRLRSNSGEINSKSMLDKENYLYMKLEFGAFFCWTEYELGCSRQHPGF